MTRRCTRRAALATAGGLGVALAGCLGDGRFWDDPPSFDATGLETATDEPLPERPSPVPVTLADDRLEGFVDRVDALLEPIPEPLTAETVPNGEIRAATNDERAAAREAQDRLIDAVDRSETGALSTASTAVDACGHAAAAAATWAAITVDRSTEAVTSSPSEVRSRIDELAAAIPADAAGSAEGVVVYGAIEQWLDEATVSPTSGSRDPIQAGQRAADTERARTTVAAGEHLRDRYVDSLADPRPITDALTSGIDDLAPQVESRFDRYYDSDRAYFRHVQVDPETFLDRDVTPGEPGADLLSEKLYDIVDRTSKSRLAWPGEDVSHPAATIRRTYRTLATFDGIDALIERLDDGDDLFPTDGTTVREARSTAIDAVAELSASASPLETWLARPLVGAFEDPDEALASISETDPDLHAVASVYGEYVWIESLARSASNATETVEAAVESE